MHSSIPAVEQTSTIQWTLITFILAGYCFLGATQCQYEMGRRQEASLNRMFTTTIWGQSRCDPDPEYFIEHVFPEAGVFFQLLAIRLLNVSLLNGTHPLPSFFRALVYTLEAAITLQVARVLITRSNHSPAMGAILESCSRIVEQVGGRNQGTQPLTLLLHQFSRGRPSLHHATSEAQDV